MVLPTIAEWLVLPNNYYKYAQEKLSQKPVGPSNNSLLTSEPLDWYPAISMVWPWSAVTMTNVSPRLSIPRAVSTAWSRAMASCRATVAC